MISSAHYSPLSRLLLHEALLKLISALIFILFPNILYIFLFGPKSPLPPPETSLLLLRVFGTQTLTFALACFLASGQSDAARKSRKVVYWVCLGREGFLMGLLLLQIWGMDEEGGFNGGRNGLGFAKRGLWAWVYELLPCVVGRIWALWKRPGWFG